MSDFDVPTKGKRGAGRRTFAIREAIERAFREVGGHEYLVRVAKKRPDVFCALVQKLIPQETRSTILAAYQAMPMPVVTEERDALPAPANAVTARFEILSITGPGDPDF